MNALRALRGGSTAIALLVVLSWPALYNGQPLFYPDTTAYIRGADAGLSKLTHRTTVWSEASDVPRPATSARRDSTATRAPTIAADTTATARRSLSSIRDRTVLAGRSIYYGALLYLAHLTGRLWPAVFAQAAVVLLALALTLLAFGRFSWRRLAATTLGVAALTQVAWFVSFLMPDLFAAIAILAVASLLGEARTTRATMILWSSVLTAALLFHSSHVLIVLGVLAIAVPVMLLVRTPVPRRGLACVAIALVVAVAGEAAFNAGVARLVGAPPIRPPFLTARVVADGPGYRFLAARCPDVKLTVCAFVGRLRGTTADEFLWSTDTVHGVFAAADPATRRLLSREDLRVARGALAFEPVGQLAASVRDAWIQLIDVGLAEFNYGPAKRAFLRTHVPEPYLDRMRRTRAWREIMPVRGMTLVAATTTLLALAFLAIVLALPRPRDAVGSRLWRFVAVVAAGVVVNAVVCGMLSTLHDRYQARVAWLLPLAAALVAAQLVEARQRTSAERETMRDAGAAAWERQPRAAVPE